MVQRCQLVINVSTVIQKIVHKSWYVSTLFTVVFQFLKYDSYQLISQSRDLPQKLFVFGIFRVNCLLTYKER